MCVHVIITPDGRNKRRLPFLGDRHHSRREDRVHGTARDTPESQLVHEDTRIQPASPLTLSVAPPHLSPLPCIFCCCLLLTSPCLPHLADPRVNPTSPLPHALKINVDVVSGGWAAAAAAAGDRRQERSPAAKQLYDAVICLPTRACASTHWLVGAEIR